jgi:putative MATE family efflux protein
LLTASVPEPEHEDASVTAHLSDDNRFFPAMLRLAAPIGLQQLVMASLNAIDVVMIGQLGETAVAGAGLANQFFFLLSLVIFGIGSGSGVFGAQFWGRRDVESIRRVLGIGLIMSLATGCAFAALAVFAPQVVLGVYSADPAVIEVGSSYLRIAGLGYVVTAITGIYAYLMRSTGNVRLPMAVSICALSLKTGLSYLLIFGHLGFPEMGVAGAAISTCVARYLECIVLLALIYGRRLPVAASLREMTGFIGVRGLVSRFLRTAMPVILGEFGWALGNTAYNLIYARIATDSIAAYSIAATIEGLALVPFIGLTNAAAIMIGNRIGAGEEDRSAQYAGKFLSLAASGGVAVGVLMAASSGVIFTLYKITDLTEFYARIILLMMATVLWIKASNFVMIAGILRGGGDTRFAFAADAGCAWFIGIPLAAVGAFVFGLPVYWVFLMALSEEVVKFDLSLRRVVSKQWIHNVVQFA